MVSSILKQAAGILRNQKKSKRWQKGFVCLAVVAVVATIVILTTTGQALTNQEQVLNCQLQVHEHTDSCYDQEKDLICGYADYVIHVHNDECYDAEGTLVCQLPENKEHKHADACYEEQQVLICEAAEEAGAEGHVHTEECYGMEQNQSPCDKEEHTHDDSCYDSALACAQEEHSHGDGRYDENGELTCENEEHRHGDGCYEKSLVCGKEEHTHDDSCAESQEQVLICGKEESESVAGHAHTDACYRTEKVLICGKLELHMHEESLVKDGGCYEKDAFDEETGEFIEGSLPACGLLQLEEHVHDEDCFGDEKASEEEEALPEEEEEVPEEGLNRKEFTGEYADGTLKVIAFYGKEAEIPEEAELIVEAITDEDDYKEKTNAARELTGYRTASAELLYNIGFFIDGEEIEPKGTVTMEFQFFQDGMEAGEKVTVIHFDENDPKVLESTDMSKNEDGSLSTSFDSDSFSPFMLIVGGEEVRFVGLVGGGMQAYEQMDRESGNFDLSVYASDSEEPLRIEVLEILEDAQGEEWYRFLIMTEDEELSRALDGYPYIPAKDVVLEGTYTRQILTTTDKEGAKITVDGFFPENVKLTAERIYDPEIANVVETIEANLSGEDIGDFRLVYKLGVGTTEKLFWPATVTVSSFDVGYYDYDNLGSWVYQTDLKESDAAVEKIEGVTKEEGTVEFRTVDFSTFYVAMALIEGREEYLSSLSEPGSVIESWDFEEIAEEEDEIPAKMPSKMKARAATQPSEQQVGNKGGSNTNKDNITVSKTIQGTNLENVFDITLQVSTTEQIKELSEDPDMAIVIVMDISNTMNQNFGSKGGTRYTEAMDAASNFIDQFKNQCQKNSRSRIGFVAFNTNSTQIFGLSQCCTDEQATNLKYSMKVGTGNIIHNYTKAPDGSSNDPTRFTNIEAGLKQAQDMLNTVTNDNKYVVFLSDGFPTTYLRNSNGMDYQGYNPYTESGTKGADGVFYDYVRNVYCNYGTDYSNKAAIRARTRAKNMKDSGIKIFSIGIALGDQTIDGYVAKHAGKIFSTVDRTSTTYEIGGGSDIGAYKNWLKGTKNAGIGSGFYYDSTDEVGLVAAFDEIFKELKTNFDNSDYKELWTVKDPMPTLSGSAGNDKVGFIGFYNQSNTLVTGNQPVKLIGTYGKGGENTAECASNTINWDLKNSGYKTSKKDGITTYTYTLKYRVRLENEESGFIESTNGSLKIYPTNDETTLTYKIVENGKVSPKKKQKFPIPSVKGYLSELEFAKVDRRGEPLSGAVFTLSHDTTVCKICKGDGKAVSIKDVTGTSNAEGKVTFTNIPSGHRYILKETTVPNGYVSYGEIYKIEVAYDNQTITVVDVNGNSTTLSDSLETVVNDTIYKLPKTGGPGASDYTKAGVLLALLAAVSYLGYSRRKSMRGDK